jgi:hypothetical protein
MSTQRAATPVIASLSLGLVALAAPASAQLAATSPFLPANAVIVSNTPVESTTIELHGVVPTPSGPLFAIYNVTRKASSLVGLNEQGSWGSAGAGGTFVVRSYRQLGEQDQVTVEYQGQTQTLSTKSPKVAIAGRAGAANAAAAPAGAPVPGGRGGGGGAPGGGGPGGGGRGGGGAGGPGGAPGGGFPVGGAPGGGGRGGFGVAGGAAGGDAAGGQAAQITANQAATLAEAVQKQQQNRAAALANPTAATTTPTTPAAPANGGGGRGAAPAGGRGARGN